MDHQNNHERFTRLLLEAEPVMLRSVLVMVPNRTDARDILQETAVALWRQFDSYDPQRPFVNWAMGFARIETRRFLARAQRRAQLSEKAMAWSRRCGWRRTSPSARGDALAPAERSRSPSRRQRSRRGSPTASRR